jgi:hypothetical protein
MKEYKPRQRYNIINEIIKSYKGKSISVTDREGP